MQRAFLLLAITVIVTSPGFAEDDAQPANAKPRPMNVLFILADDLGWSDTTLYGQTELYRTPNLERLARRGMLFTRAYTASPLCSPTRASILTGLNPARTGITTPACHLPQVRTEAVAGTQAPAAAKAIMPVTATRLKTDYYTLAEALRDAGYATGHFGKWHLGAEPLSPLQHGFDIDVPHWPGPGPAGSYVAPWKFPDFDPDTPDEHIEDRMAKEAVAFLERHRDEPFFLNYWMFSVHAPFDAKRDLIERYRGVVKADDAQRSPTYAAMVESMDDAVGALLDTLDRLGIAERTIIVFTSDNGGNMYNEVDGTTPTSNRPLRGGKGNLYDGGIRVPCIVSWPDVVKGGTRNDELVQSCDFYPTLLEMLGREPQPGQSFDGVSIVPALQGKKLERDDGIVAYFPHQTNVPDWLPPAVSVHRGDWKLIRIFHGGDDGAHRWKLYDLRSDIGEQHDVSAEHPDVVRELDGLIEQFLTDTHAVRPLPNPAFDPSRYHLENEGKAAPRNAQKSGPKPAKPAAGWQPSKDCTLSLAEASLVVTSTGPDPHISFNLPQAIPAGKFVFEFTASSTADGRAQFFWQQRGVTPAFFRDRSERFELTHDGEPHTHRIAFTTEKPLTAVRLDPAQNAGETRLIAMKLLSVDGDVLHLWRF